MPYNGETARNQLLRLQNYAAAATFISSVSWKREGTANVSVERQLDPTKVGEPISEAVCIVVGEVSEHKLYTSTVGNYNPDYNTLPTAKFQLTLVEPSDVHFAPDYSRAWNAIGVIEDTIATGDDQRYLRVTEGSQNSLRLSSPLMEARRIPVADGAPLDDDTMNWSVPTQHQAAFDVVKNSHQILPLNVYDQNNNFVSPERVTGCLRGALVECYFRIKHHYIAGGEVKFNTFSAILEQVIILRPALPKVPSPYRNNRKGPYRPSPRQNVAGPSASPGAPASAASTASTATRSLVIASTSNAAPQPSANAPGSPLTDDEQHGADTPHSRRSNKGKGRAADDELDSGPSKKSKGA